MVVKNQELECVEIAKLLGVTMSNNLTWNMHIDQIIKKASKRMYFLIHLERANVARHELILFLYILYKVSHDLRIVCVFLRPAIVFKERSRECRETGTINHLPGKKALELSNIMSINDYIASFCKKTFLSIANDPAHRLHNMLQSSGPSCYNLRCKRRFAIPKCKTERFKNSFLVRSCIDNEF